MKPLLASVILLAGLAAPAAARAAAPAAEFPGPVYVTVQGANAVEVFPSKRVFRGLTTAHYDGVSPNGRMLIVGSFTTGKVFLLSTKTGRKLATFDVGKSVQGVVFTPDGRLAMAVDPNGGAVAVIDIKKLKVIKTIPVGPVPHNIGFSPHGRLAYVTLQGGTGVAVIDMKQLKKVKEIPVPGIVGPHNLDFSDGGRIMWVRDIVGHVAAIDLRTEKELAVVPVGHGHAGIDVIPGGKYVLTGAIADKVVDVIDPRTFKIVKSIVVGKGPHGVRTSPHGHWAYADVTGSNDLVVIDMRTLKVVQKIPTAGSNPFWVAVPDHT
jgi:YVTN family beta-propeller protein